MAESKLIPLAEIQAAAGRIAPHVRPTPVTRDERLGAWLKWESKQVTGSFKPRGALNKVLSLPAEARARGLVACSAGNHGQGVALAAGIAGAQVRVYVPEAAAAVKVEKMRQMGAEVIHVPGIYADAERAAMGVARDEGQTFVSPYDDRAIIAGQGTLALEWLEQTPSLATALIPVGGGGLIAGVGAALRALRPQTRVIGVQSAAHAYLHTFFHGGDVRAVVEAPSHADGLAGGLNLDSMTLPMLAEACDDLLLVTEDEIEQAMAYAYKEYGEVIEGSGAVGLAAVLTGRVTGDHVGVLVSGGNVDADRHAAIIRRWA